jgi:hypothetical protein
MKTRNGFISNSSSSSFVIALKKVPKTSQELQEMIFGDDEFFPMPNPEDFDIPRKALYYSDIIFNDIKKQKPATKKKIIEECKSGYIGGFPNHSCNYVSPGWEKEIDEWAEKCQKYAEDKALEFINSNKIFIVEYGDDTKDGSVLEHGGTFRRIPHMTISHH